MNKGQLLSGGSKSAAVLRISRFSDTISYEDRQRLRAVVRKTHARYFRDPTNNVEVDKLIDQIGPKVQMRLLRLAIEKDG